MSNGWTIVITISPMTGSYILHRSDGSTILVMAVGEPDAWLDSTIVAEDQDGVEVELTPEETDEALTGMQPD